MIKKILADSFNAFMYMNLLSIRVPEWEVVVVVSGCVCVCVLGVELPNSATFYVKGIACYI